MSFNWSVWCFFCIFVCWLTMSNCQRFCKNRKIKHVKKCSQLKETCDMFTVSPSDYGHSFCFLAFWGLPKHQLRMTDYLKVRQKTSAPQGLEKHQGPYLSFLLFEKGPVSLIFHILLFILQILAAFLKGVHGGMQYLVMLVHCPCVFLCGLLGFVRHFLQLYSRTATKTEQNVSTTFDWSQNRMLTPTFEWSFQHRWMKVNLGLVIVC